MRRPLLTVCLLALFILAGCGFPWEEPPKLPAERERAEAPEVPEAPSEPEIPAPPVETKPVTEQVVTEEPAVEDFVRVVDYIPDIMVELRYATSNHFTGEVIYDFTDAYLRYGTVKKLADAQTALAEQGYGLKIWDAFRPIQAQFTLWDICPDGRYVSDPNKGFSSHSRGNTVDVTLVGTDGEEISMPTGFDDFSSKADRDYSDVDEETAANALLLESAMTEAGFQPYSGEWWHFSDADVYDVEEAFTPKADE